MTLCAWRAGLRVIEREGLNPGVRKLGVAGLAFVAGQQSRVVLSGLAGGPNCIVAVEATRGDGRVIHGRADPCQHRVAFLAPLHRRNMIRALAGCEDGVMAIGTHTHALRVIKRQRRNPFRRRLVMTRFAHVTGVKSLVMLAALAADIGKRPGVATDAVGRDGRVINVCRNPTRRGMARAAIQRGGDMVLTLAARQRGVVAV